MTDQVEDGEEDDTMKGQKNPIQRRHTRHRRRQATPPDRALYQVGRDFLEHPMATINAAYMMIDPLRQIGKSFESWE